MLLFFAELLVRGTLLCLLVALTLFLMRRCAATYRHLICTVALCGLLTLPLVQELLPPLPLLTPSQPEPTPFPRYRSETTLPRREGGWRSEERTKPGGFEPGGFEPAGFEPGKSEPGGFEAYGFGLWALGAAILLLRLAVALVRLHTLAKQSKPTRLLDTEILVSETITTPLTWGVRHPVILLPTALLFGETAVVESALRHEQAHIARRDWLWHLLAEIVCALCWFQPGAWWLRRRLRAESERACDDRVLLSGVSGPDYAAHLLEILKVGRANALAPGMAAVGSMEARVKHILDPKKPRRAHGLRLALTAVLGLVLLPLASLKVAAKPGERPVSRLQEAVELLAPKLTFLTPSALLAQAKVTLIAPKPFAEPEGGEPKRAGRLIMPHAEPPHPDSTIPLDKVVWGMRVDGLEPGLLLTGVTDLLGPGGLAIGYTALVRNRTKQPITFLVRLLQYDGYDVPFTQEDSAKIPDIERAKGVPHTRLGEDAVYQVTLAPGESVLVPGQEAHHNLRVLIGSGDGGKSPYFEKMTPGMLTLVQPLTVYRSPDRTKLPLHETKSSLTKMSPDGTLYTEGAINVGMPGSGGTQLEAKLWLPKILGTSKTPTAPATPAASEPSGRVLPLDKVIWNEAVDGLAAGFLLTSSPRVPLSSKLTYQTLVRNTSNKPISFMTRLLQYDGYETPTVDGKPTKGAKRTYPLDPLYEVTLAPGESVLVPGNTGVNLAIYVGDGDSDGSPSIAEITPGHQKIVQPITIYRSPDHSKLPLLLGIDFLTKVSPDGRTRSELATRASGGKGRIEGGQTLEAYSYLEIGTLNAAAERNASAAVWGKVDKGLQCGIRMLTDRRKFLTGDTLEAELLWRNVSDKKAYWVHPRQLDIVPFIREASGRGRGIDTGARFELVPFSTDYAPGEVRSLGTLKVTLVAEGTPSPKSNREPGHITLAPGTYFFSGSGGVSSQGDPCPHSGEIAFTVLTDQPTPVKDEGIAWGAEINGYRYGLRSGGTINALEIWVQNRMPKDLVLTYPQRPHDFMADFLIFDSTGKPVLLPQPDLANKVPQDQRTLHPGGKYRLYTRSLQKPLSSQNLTGRIWVQWQISEGKHSTGQLILDAPQPPVQITPGVAWGRSSNGIQLGLRLPKDLTSFAKLGDARFEVVLRNRSDKPLTASWITPANFSFYGPDLFTKDGEPIPYIHTVAGPYRGESRELASGETIVLGTIQIPREAHATLDAIPGPYEARFSLGMTVTGKGEQTLSARLPFQVVKGRS